MHRMDDPNSEYLAINLARRVLTREISIDFGLVRAQSSGVLTLFVNSLNTLAGADYFDLDVLQRRIRQGAAARAVAGRTDPFPFPEPLIGWNPDDVIDEPVLDLEKTPENPPIEIPAGSEQAVSDPEEFIRKFREGIQNLDHKVKELRFQKEEVSRLLFFLEQVQSKRSVPPRPWIGSVVVVIIASLIAGVSFLVLRSVAMPALIFVGSLFLAGFLFQREYAWYERLAEIERNDAEHRSRNIQLHRKQIEECNKEIREIKKDARLRFLNLEGAAKETAQTIKEEFPSLFKETSGGRG